MERKGFVIVNPNICKYCMRKLILSMLLVVLTLLAVVGQTDLFEKRQYVFKQDTLRYRILFPENYNPSLSYPLLIFLHGSGERGNDNEKQLVHGGSLFTNPQNRQAYPAIVVFPQCPEKGFWAPIDRKGNKYTYVNKSPATEPMQLVIRLIKELKKNEAVDTKRIYVAGLSMGGMGTFDLICREPKMFAAAVPICGGVSVERLKAVKKMPVRIYHGGADPVVSPENSRNAYKELQKVGSKNVEYIEFPGVGHGSWVNAFAEPDFLSWIFSKKKK